MSQSLAQSSVWVALGHQTSLSERSKKRRAARVGWDHLHLAGTVEQTACRQLADRPLDPGGRGDRGGCLGAERGPAPESGRRTPDDFARLRREHVGKLAPG
jgi:hypothetical protein